jgi:heavy metal sensor kinase
MTLTTRLTAYFLAALAAVLIGFSATLYLLARSHFEAQTSERLEAALDTLAACVDVGDGLLEWEGHERHLTLGKDPGPEQVRWTLHGATGALIAKSDNLGDPAALDGSDWRTVRRSLQAEHPAPSSKQEPMKHTRLVFTVAQSQEPQNATLGTLAAALVGLSALVLVVAAVTGRWLCRRALAPVTAMADAASAMTAADLDARLPDAGTNDELADLQHAFNDLLTRLQDAFERQRRFTGDASHQLRTPLAAVLGQVEVALRRERSPNEYREVLGRVLHQTQHLRQLVDMLLFLARADAQSRLPPLETIDVSAWLATHMQAWADHPRWPDMRFEGEPAQARIQPALLGQLLDNLLDNACKYSNAGSPIGVQLTCNDQWVLLSVEDAGAGIAAEDVPHLFEPFYRSEGARRAGKAGVGLGLAVAQRIAAALDGAIEVSSVAGKTHFQLRLPAA